MKFLINENKKIILGWSPKCGCTNLKLLHWYLNNEIEIIDNKLIHDGNRKNGLSVHNDDHISYIPQNKSDFHLVMVVRNPYKRIVSCFLDKFRNNDYFTKLFYMNCNKKLTFNNFTSELARLKYFNVYLVKEPHVSPQTSWHFSDFEKCFDNFKSVKMFDLENIDYQYIEDIIKTKIPQCIIDFRQPEHTIKKNNNTRTDKVFDLIISDYCEDNVSLEHFYNEDIKNKVEYFYNKDFEMLKKFNFNYTLSI